MQVAPPSWKLGLIELRWGFKGNASEVRIGCYIWDHYSIIPSQILATNNDAKFKALTEDLWLCNKLNFDNVEIEGDSAIVINALISQSIPNL